MQKTSVIHIDQVLHGYAHGHRELAASIALDELSRSIMLVQSDLLATDLTEGASYLTGYPLKAASKYVLARTWAAGRGYRPGSVWTHSLVLDYQALALVPDLLALRSLFRNPNLTNPNEYAERIEFSLVERSLVSVEQGSRVACALMQLYGNTPTRDIIVPQENGEFDESLALALWRQMWPGMRREFAFFTGAGDHPVGFDSGCVLRFLRQACSEIEHCASNDVGLGCQALLEDLPKSGPTDLRALLGRYVIESKHPRQLVFRLASMQSKRKSSSLADRLRDLRSLTREEPLPRLVRDVLVEELQGALTSSDLVTLVCEFRNAVINFDLTEISARIGSLSDHEFCEIFLTTQPSNENELGGRLFAELMRLARLEVLAAAARPENRLLMLQRRLELARVSEFWPKNDEDRADIITRARSFIALGIEEGLEIFGTSIGHRTVASLLHATSDNVPKAAVSLLANADRGVRDVVAQWIVRVPRRLDCIASMPEVIAPEIIEALAKAQIQSANSIADSSIWATLFNSVNLAIDQSLGSATLVVGYITALKLDGEPALKLAKTVFDPLQRVVRRYRLSHDEVRYLGKELLALSRSGSVQASLTRSAVLKWPLRSDGPSVLAISGDETHLIDLVAEIAVHQGRSSLKDVLANGHLSPAASRSITHFLNKKNTFSGLFKRW